MDFKKPDMNEKPLHEKAKMDTLQALRKMAMQMIHERMGDEDECGPGEAKVVIAAGEGEPEGDAMDMLAGEEGEASPEDEEAELLRKLEEVRAKKKQLA